MTNASVRMLSSAPAGPPPALFQYATLLSRRAQAGNAPETVQAYAIAPRARRTA
jgi:hypothetical protein